MIDVNGAIKAAIDYVKAFSNIFPNADPRLEETELDDEDYPKVWLITLSFMDNPLTGHRIYKLFRIDADNGTVKAMKNRSVV